MSSAIRGDTYSGYGHLMSRLDRQLLYNDSGNMPEFAEAIKEVLRVLENDRNLDQLSQFGLKLLVRVFGEAVLDMKLSNKITGWSTETNIDRMLRGGWLRRLSERTVMVARVDVRSNKRPLRAGDSLSTLNSGTRNLLSNFLPKSDFIKLVVSTSRKVTIPLSKFPAKVQTCILQRSYYDLVRSPNQKVYYRPYFKVNSNEQFQPLLKNNALDRALELDFYEAYLIAILRFPKDYPFAFELVDIRRSSTRTDNSTADSSSIRKDVGDMNSARSSVSKYPDRSGGMNMAGTSSWSRSPRPPASSSSSTSLRDTYSDHLGSRAGYDPNRNPQTPNRTMPSPSASTFRQPVRGYGSLPGFIMGQLQEFLQESPLIFLNKFGLRGWTNGSPYLCLLQEVLLEFVPHAVKDTTYNDGNSNGYGDDRNGRRGFNAGARSVSPQRKRESLSGYDDTMSGGPSSGLGRQHSPNGRNSRRGSTSTAPSTAEYDNRYIGAGVKLTIEGEMFLKMLADFWIDIALIVRRNHAQGAREKAKLTKQMEHYHHQYRHPSPLEVMTLDNSGVEWHESTLQCIYLALVRVLSDPSLCTQYSNILKSNADTQVDHRKSTRSRHHGGYSSNKYNTVSEGNSPKTMHILQQPLFDMLRYIFSKSHLQVGSDSNRASRNQHVLAIEVWLCYIQPWKAPAIARGEPLEKIDQDPSQYNAKYTEKWKPYIASNLHYYTTLLVMFMEMMSKMELSTVEDVGLMHLYLLEKTLMSFAPIMDDIKSLVKDMREWYPHNCRVNNRSGQSRMGASFEDTHGSPTNLNGTGNIDEIKAYRIAMRIQHQLLYEDASIDRFDDGYCCGIVCPKEYCTGDGATAKAVQKIMSSLFLGIKETERHCSQFQWFSLKSWSSVIFVPCAEMFDLVFGTSCLCHHFKLSQKFTASYWISDLTPNASAVDTAMRKRLEEARTGLDNLLECGFSDNKDEGAEGGPSSLYSQTQLSEDIITQEGLLTTRGKYYIKAGRPIPVELIRRSEDVLFRDPYSHEVPSVALFFIKLSERLNETYDLPRHKDAAKWTWERVSHAIQ